VERVESQEVTSHVNGSGDKHEDKHKVFGQTHYFVVCLDGYPP